MNGGRGSSGFEEKKPIRFYMWGLGLTEKRSVKKHLKVHIHVLINNKKNN